MKRTVRTLSKHLLHDLFWYVRIPQLIAAALLIAAGAFFVLTRPEALPESAAAAFAGLWLLAAGFIGWSAFIAHRLSAPLKSALDTFTAEAGKFPELTDILEHKSLHSLSSNLTTVFQYLNDSLLIYRQANEIAAEGNIMINAQGVIQSVNPGLVRMFGYAAEELIGQNVAMLMTREHSGDHDRYISRYLETGDPKIIGKGRELEAVRKDGGFFPIYLSVSHIKSALRGDIFCGVIVDLSLLKRREDDLIEARDRAEAANKAKDAFIANISHELRTPLNAIIGFCEMMNFSALSTKQKEYLEYIHSAAQALLAIVNELIDASAVTQGRLKLLRASFNLHKAIQETAAGFEAQAREKGLKFSTQISSGLPRYCIGDNNKLRQVVAHLLSNAVRFTEKGHILLVADTAGLSEKDTLNVRISVADTGIGVPPDKREIIFERFSQADASLSRKYGGTGLGLSVCRELLDLMGGGIRHEPNTPAGSRFVVDLPLELANAVDFDLAAHPGRTPEPRAENLHILVVEDDVSNMALIREFLAHTGCRILTASNGIEAIGLLQKERVDIVLLDISMPVMEGIETILHIRESGAKDPHGRPIFVAAMTANAMRGDEEKYLGYGFDEYVPKPISFTTLTGLLDRYAQATEKYVA